MNQTNRIPSVVLVGQPNAGKSSLFNALCGEYIAMVSSHYRLTRDRHQHELTVDGGVVTLWDTAGYDVGDDIDEIGELAIADTLGAMTKAQLVVLVVDGKRGVTAGDQDLAALLRSANVPSIVAVNKTEGDHNKASSVAEAASLGCGEVVPVSANRRSGLEDLKKLIAQQLQPVEPETADEDEDEERIRLAIIGRPNAGKSSLVNKLIGDERVLVSDVAGTTRESIEIPLRYAGTNWLLVDTAGMRRRRSIQERVERNSVGESIASIDAADVAIVMIDAAAGVVEQDITLVSLATRRSKSVVIALNKIDLLDQNERAHVTSELFRRLPFGDWIPRLDVSVLNRRGVGALMREVKATAKRGKHEFTTSSLTETLQRAVRANPPPRAGRFTIKPKLAHPVTNADSSQHVVCICGTQVSRLPSEWKRYFIRQLRESQALTGVPLQVETKDSTNPFSGRKQLLTPRQIRSRSRIRGR